MSRSPTTNREVKFTNVLTTKTRIFPYRFDEELWFSNPGALVVCEGCDRSVRRTDGGMVRQTALMKDLRSRINNDPGAVFI